MASRVTRVVLRDYRSIARCDVELQPLTVLVGLNGSGKSNFLDALRFVADAMYFPLDQVAKTRDGPPSILRKLPNGQSAASFSIQLAFALEDGRAGEYSLKIGAGADGGLVIEEERCIVDGQGFTSTPRTVTTHIDVQTGHGLSPAGEAKYGDIFLVRPDRPSLVAYGTQPLLAPVLSLLTGFTFYSPNPEKMRLPAAIGPGQVLARDGSNAADVLARIERTSPDLARRIKEYLSIFNPEFKDVTVADANNYRWLGFTPVSNPSDWTVKGSEVSDGTLRAFGILLAIFQAGSPGSPVSLVGLEEPESNLHPAAAGVLLDALLEASRSVPIIASTHSADLLDRKSLPENALLAVALADGETMIGPVSEEGKSILRQRLYTAGDLLRNDHLTPSVTGAST